MFIECVFLLLLYFNNKIMDKVYIGLGYYKAKKYTKENYKRIYLTYHVSIPK